jgi:catechol 2,3-dioxygenase-like lactoylglutathione lyase family enzyme
VRGERRGGRANKAVRGIERRSTMKSLTFSVEVITVPVSNVDRAIRFYADQVGFTIDVDYAPRDSFRVVQLTPLGSSCSLQIGKGLTDAPAGSLRNAHLVVSDLQVARSRLLERGVRGRGDPAQDAYRRLGRRVRARDRSGPRRLCELRQLLRSGWQYLGAARTRPPHRVTRATSG